MILMAPCIIDFIGENGLHGPVGGGGGPGHSWALKWHERNYIGINKMFRVMQSQQYIHH